MKRPLSIVMMLLLSLSMLTVLETNNAKAAELV